MYKKLMLFLSIATIQLQAALDNPLEYQAKEFSYLIGKTRFEDDLLNMHFQL
mgnify:CR=1 FL=1